MRRISLLLLLVSGRVAADAPAPLLADREAVAAQHAKGCADTCCLPHHEWFGGDGAPTAADAETARRTLGKATDPQLIVFALRVLATAAQLADARTVERFLDDGHAAGELPEVMITQQVRACYPVSWRAVTVGGEALATLRTIYKTHFVDAAAYRAWARTHADPEGTFDYWYAQLEQSRPANRDVLARLRARDATLAVRVVAAYAYTSEDYGAPGELGKLLAAVLGTDRALRWLAGSETFPEWKDVEVWHRVVRTILDNGEALFTDKHVPALQALAKGLSPRNVAQLAVLTSRLRPRDARAMWTAGLGTGLGEDLVLREAARRDPIGFADTLARWYFGPAIPPRHEPEGYAVPILEGLAEARTAGRATFQRLVAQHPFDADRDNIAEPLARAASAAGCRGVPTESDVRIHMGKGATQIERDVETARAHKARELLAVAVRNCR
jgi:hypothetical protein